MRLVRSLLEAAFMLVVSSVTAVAHHSAAAYDIGSTIRIDGTVTQYDWGNPHVYIEIDGVASGASEARIWSVELAHPGTVSLFGLEPSSLKAGDEVSILANPPRNAARSIASLVSLEIDGETAIDIRELGQAFQSVVSRLGTEAATGIEGVWIPATDAWQEAGLSDITNLPLTELAQAAVNEFDPRSMSTGIECLPEPIPSGMLSPSAPSFLSFDIEPDRVTIRGGSDAMVRAVPLDRNEHPSEPPSPYGHSIGWWEDDALVIDTVDFEPHPQGIAPRVPSGAQKHLIERFELNPDGKSLTYRFELSDPEFLVDTISATVNWLYLPDAEIDPVPCTPENARRFLAE
jgi:hypothetical protein